MGRRCCCGCYISSYQFYFGNYMFSYERGGRGRLGKYVNFVNNCDNSGQIIDNR